MERDKEGVKRERQSKGLGEAPPEPTYERKALHSRFLKGEADAMDTDEESEQWGAGAQQASMLPPTASSWRPNTADTAVMGQKKKWAYPFANFFNAGCPGKGVQQADEVRQVTGRKHIYAATDGGKASCQGAPREIKGTNTGVSGDEQEGNEEVEQSGGTEVY